ncbi:solute carrier family 22 member 7-like [Brachionichthys hirsutus]|uniref:solute carrier family 22 member 7-like n=1 Tax=Brachionichthys hirsutus TaxID=412623 RepID=UPI00360447FC
MAPKKFENMLMEINGFGLFQIFVVTLLAIPRIFLSCHLLLNNFIAALPPHRCDISNLHNGLFRNVTVEQELIVSTPVRGDGTRKPCEMFAEPQFGLLANGSNITDLQTMPCQNGWIYDNSTFTSTIATEWDLVCDRKSLANTSTTIFFMGVMVGSIILGYLSDKYGRKNTLFVASVMAVVFGFSSALANSFILFVVLRFLTGVGLAGVPNNTMVLSIEWVDIGHRALISVIGGLSWCAGLMLLPAVAFLTRDWRTLVMAVTAPLGLTLLTFWWIPESARWLLVNGEVERAQFYLDRCAKFNKRPKLSSDLILDTLSDMKIMEEQSKGYTYLDLIKTPKMRKLTVLTGILWFGVGFTYYGLSFNILDFGLNLYVTHFVFAAIEVPFRMMTYWFLGAVGRRRCQAGSLLLTGICIAANMFVPTGLWYVRAAVAIFGKGLAGFSFTAVYLYTAELYPTILRQRGMGYTSFLCRVGVSVAPLILLLGDVWPALPHIIFCFGVFLSGLLCLLLPETLNAKLPETIDDIEKPRSVNK